PRALPAWCPPYVRACGPDCSVTRRGACCSRAQAAPLGRASMPRRRGTRPEGDSMTITLDWLGCATFRLSVDGLVIWLDTFVDRPETAPSVGLTSEDITEADFALIGHSHWDHLAGADVVALRTGA